MKSVKKVWIMENSAIILLAHGSPDLRWKEPFEKIVSNFSKKINIKLAYMDFIKPTFEDAVKELFDKNINQIKLLPLFMAGGGHVDRDIPKLVSSAKKRFPKIEVDILPPIGEHTEVSSIMIDVIKGYCR